MKISEILLLLERDGWRLKTHGGITPALHASHETWARYRSR